MSPMACLLLPIRLSFEYSACRHRDGWQGYPGCKGIRCKYRERGAACGGLDAVQRPGGLSMQGTGVLKVWTWAKAWVSRVMERRKVLGEDVASEGVGSV
jgi:hypothetical protein